MNEQKKLEILKKYLDPTFNYMDLVKFKQTENGKWEKISDTKRINNKDKE